MVSDNTPNPQPVDKLSNRSLDWKLAQWEELHELDTFTHRQLWQKFLDGAGEEAMLWKVVKAIDLAKKYPDPKPVVAAPMTPEQRDKLQQSEQARVAKHLQQAAENTPAKLALLEQLRRISP